MFGSLLGTTNETWCSNKENTIIYLSTEKYNTMWQVFTVYTTPKDTEYLTTNFASEEKYLSFLNECKNRSIYDFGTTFKESDSILTLSTCAKNDNYRVVIQAKLIKKDIR